MKLFRVSCVGLIILCLAIVPVYSKSEQGQGKGQDNHSQGNQGHSQGNQGQGRGQSESAPGQSQANEVRNAQATTHTASSEIRKHTIERGRDQANLRANRPEKTSRDPEKDREKGSGVKRALEKARWSYNPLDERGQGNMGKVDMRDPYGFDKDSGREKSQRGRPIKGNLEEPTLNLSGIVGIEFDIGDSWLLWLQSILEYFNSLAQQYPFYAEVVRNWEDEINSYTSISGGGIAVDTQESINYTLTLSSLEELYGKTLLVTTTLKAAEDYDSVYVVADPSDPDTWISETPIHYKTGEVIEEQTQEVVVGEDDTLFFSYDPADNLIGFEDLSANLSVTITEPVSGASYTINYDRSIYLYPIARCPYGKVYDVKTKQPIVGAKVSVYFEDGSLVALDKASNPTASNPQTTDATGRYGFKLPTNRKYYIVTTAAGYEEYKSPVFTEKWHVLREDIALTPIK